MTSPLTDSPGGSTQAIDTTEQQSSANISTPPSSHTSSASANTHTGTPRIHMQLGNKRKRKLKATTTTNTAVASTFSGSSSSSSDEDDDAPAVKRKNTSESMQQPEGWRVKLYRLNADGSWDDCGTGRIVCAYKKSGQAPSLDQDAVLYQELGEPTLVMQSEEEKTVLLRTRILLREAYQRQGDNIITWCEPHFDSSKNGVDLALSFQDNAGCLDIWRQITHIQSRATEWFRVRGILLHHVHDSKKAASAQQQGEYNQSETSDMGPGTTTGSDLSSQQQHDQQQPHDMWGNVQESSSHGASSDEQYREQGSDAVAVSMAAAAAATYNSDNSGQSPHDDAAAAHAAPKLPNPPTLGHLEEIADTIAAAQLQLRDALAMYISQQECSYLKALLALFPSAESKGDYGALATLAACIKTILLLNDPSIIELIVADQVIFENVCSTLEYDPDLRDKANHRWFLRERAKFRTVVPMQDEQLVATIHRSFRVTYLRDTLLRPTMDEGSLSTLTSLQTFTHADLVKAVTSGTMNVSEEEQQSKENVENTEIGDSYLVQVIRLLGKEITAIMELEWEELETRATEDGTPVPPPVVRPRSPIPNQPEKESTNASWKQHLVPQDESLASRKMRRRGCLSFLRELFNMVRISLQQNERDVFFADIVSTAVDLNGSEAKDSPGETSVEGDDKQESKGSESSQEPQENKEEASASQPSAVSKANISDAKSSIENGNAVYLLGLLGTVLSDPTVDTTEKGAALEIISTIAMHDPCHVRRHCLDSQQKENRIEGPAKPAPNEKRHIIFYCATNDLLLALLFVLATETDAGLLLQSTEIMRFILDTDLLGEHGPMGVGLGEENSIEGSSAPGSPHLDSMEHDGHHHHGESHIADQNQFLAMFYEHYVSWLVAPFQFTILHPLRVVPASVIASPSSSPLMSKILKAFMNSSTATIDEKHTMVFLHTVSPCSIRSSFAVELLNFCVRAHLYRMKLFLLRSRVLGSVLKVLAPPATPTAPSGDRCLKLAAIRFLRAILSVKDEFYHRHIIQHNLFAPVFEAFRSNPVGDNLVSSAIIEMCDFIHDQNIKSLIEYIVSKHLIPSTTLTSPKSNTSAQIPSLEDVSTPYVNTLTVLRQSYEESLNAAKSKEQAGESDGGGTSRYFSSSARPQHHLSEKAMEDQRKFRQTETEESYFDDDDDDDEPQQPLAPAPTIPVVDEVAGESELHRTPRMFSLAQAPLLANANNDGVLSSTGMELEHHDHNDARNSDASEGDKENQESNSTNAENNQSE